MVERSNDCHNEVITSSLEEEIKRSFFIFSNFKETEGPPIGKTAAHSAYDMFS